MTMGGKTLERILFPTALRDEDLEALRAALRLTLLCGGRLTILHVGDEDREHVDWSRYPHVREVLNEWGLLPAGSSVEDIAEKLGIRVRKHALHAGDVKSAVAGFIGSHPCDLLVLPTEVRTGAGRLWRPSVAEAIAGASGIPALFVPTHVPTPLRPVDGAWALKRMLVPVRDRSCFDAVLPWLSFLASASIEQPVDITLVHAGKSTAVLEGIDAPAGAATIWHRVQVDGDVLPAILRVAGGTDTDLVVMATDGHDGIGDGLFGSTTERLLREMCGPLLAVPRRS